MIIMIVLYAIVITTIIITVITIPIIEQMTIIRNIWKSNHTDDNNTIHEDNNTKNNDGDYNTKSHTVNNMNKTKALQSLLEQLILI